jgi:hypothetical protein
VPDGEVVNVGDTTVLLGLLEIVCDGVADCDAVLADHVTSELCDSDADCDAVSEFSVRDKTGVIVARDAELDGNSLGDSVGDFLCTEFVSFPSEVVLEDESSLDVETVGVFVEEVSFDIDL